MGSKSAPSHFACTACGKCCDRGPEMTLSEATALADKFILRLIFKLHILPADARSPSTIAWWKTQGSYLATRQCLDEKAHHLALLSSGNKVEKINGETRSTYLEISSIPIHLDGGKCPALKESLCSIHSERPLTCRSVPFHYSRAPSTLPKYLEKFASTPGYQCDTTSDAPVVFQGGIVVDDVMERARANAIQIHRNEEGWKGAIVALVHGPDVNKRGFPSYQEIALNLRRGATSVSMKNAWILGVKLGIISQKQFFDICQKQITLLRAEVSKASASPIPFSSPEIQVFRDMLDDYERTSPKPDWKSKLLRVLSR